ncbi:hypothetical protein [Nitrobacter sp. TKz-YC02]|uniref:hypothetical protein n=1 Tax=Nitrobacter sp. TKz-YC02 TaxID=3398704 RepID=UPI003CFA741F
MSAPTPASLFYPLYDDGNAYTWIVALVVGMAASAILSIVLQVVFLGWMQGQELRQALVTIGISIIVADQLLAIFGGLSQQLYAPDILFGSVPVPFVQGGPPAPGSYELYVQTRLDGHVKQSRCFPVRVSLMDTSVLNLQ